MVFHSLAARSGIPCLKGIIDCLMLFKYGFEAFLRICLMRRGVFQICMIDRQGLLYHAVSGAGIDYVPNDKFPAYLDRGEAVLPANEAEAYRNAKRGGERKGEEKIINQTINITVTVDKIDRESDIDELAVLISERLADEVRRSEGVYA